MLVLCYHKVNNCIYDDWNRITVNVDMFYKHMKYIKENYIIDSSLGNLSKEGTIAVTFDDGYEDFYLNVVPVISELKIPVTIFISTQNLDTDNEDWCNFTSQIIMGNEWPCDKFVVDGKDYPVGDYSERIETNKQLFQLLKKMKPDIRRNTIDKIRKNSTNKAAPRKWYKYLSSDQIRELSCNDFITIGAHTVSHSSLGYLSIEEQYNEIYCCTKTLQSIIKKPITQFSYPFGGIDDYDEMTIELLKKFGFERAFSTTRKHHLPNKNSFEIRRVCISENTLDSFIKKISDNIYE